MMLNSLYEFFWEVDDKVTPEEKIDLEAPFLEQEIKEVVFNAIPRGEGEGEAQMGYIFSAIRNSRKLLRMISSIWSNSSKVGT
jgi:hypothetical protein